MNYKIAFVVICCGLLGIFNAHADEGAITEHELSAGSVKVLAHEECDKPYMDSKNCLVTATLNHDQEKITPDSIIRDSISAAGFALNADDVAWVDHRFITLAERSAGNCSNCGGVHVVAFEDGKFYNLGKFQEYKDGKWVKNYSELVINSITSHVYAPIWSLYYSYTNHEVVLDMNKTCADEKAKFAFEQANALKNLPFVKKNVKKMKGRKFELWFEEAVGAPLLYSLGLSKFCGWKEDYAGLWKTANKHMGSRVMAKFENELANVAYATVSE